MATTAGGVAPHAAGLTAEAGAEALLPVLKSACAQVLGARQDVALAYLFGSVVRNQARVFSDVDVALVLSRHLPPVDRLALEAEIELALHRASGIDGLDVHVVNEAPLLLLGAVVTEGVLLFRRDDEFRVWFEASTRSRYFDFLPSARRMANTFAEAMRRRLAGQRARPPGEWPA